MKHELVDTIYRYSVDTGCDVIVTSRVQWSNVKDYGISRRSRVIIERGKETGVHVTYWKTLLLLVLQCTLSIIVP